MSCPHHHRHIGIVFILFLTCLLATAQTRQPSIPAEGTAADTGAISGIVVNENGQPLPDASVFIRAIGSVNQRRFVNTDREGNFHLSGLERLAYSISARVPAYTALALEPDSSQASYYRVGDSVRLVLVKGGVITGSVRTSGDEVVVGVPVQAQMIRDGNGQPLRYRALFGDILTDDRGIYRIYGLPTGTYVVMAGGIGSFWSSGINPYATDSPTYAPASTRDTAAEINVRAGEETTNVDVRYRGEAGHMVSGTANGPQPAVPVGFSITLSSTPERGAQWSVSSFQPPESSRFVLYGVADGDYDVTAQSYFPSGELSLSEPQRIKVRGADITGIKMTTKPLGSITGRLVLEDSKASECKGKRRPLFTESIVSAWHNEKVKAKELPQYIWFMGGPSSPDKEGNFLLRNLPPGQYHFIARFAAKYWYLQSISLRSGLAPAPTSTQANREVDAARNWITLKSDDRLSGLIIKLSEGAASLQGKITGREGENPPARLYVYLVPAEREKADDVLRFFAAPVLSDGKIMMNNLAPGRYWIVAQPAFDGALPPLSKLRLPDETETRAKLRRDAEASKTEIEFKPCQNVTDYQLTLKSALTAPPQ